MTAIATPTPIVKVKCHYCSKFRHPNEIHRIAKSGGVICWYCWEWHLKAIQDLGNQPPKECGNCRVTFDQLQAREHDGNVQMYIHPRDGGYQMLCQTCSDAYERKRLDLYGSTEYGWKKKLKGNK